MVTTYSPRHNERVQAMNSRVKGNRILAILSRVIVLMAVVTILGIVGKLDYQTALLEQASDTCSGQTAYTMPTFNQCMANQSEKNGDN